MTAPFPPMVSPRFQQDGVLLQYKPYPSYPTWLVAWDLTGFTVDLSEIEEDIAQLQIDVVDLTASVEAGFDALGAALALNIANTETAQFTANDALAAAGAAQATADEALAAAANAPGGYTLSPKVFKTLTGGFGSAQFTTTVWLNTYYLMNGLNTSVEINLPLAAGTHTISMLWVRGPANCDVTAYIDGSSLGGANGYNATNLNAEWSWITSALAAGLHNLKLTVTGKQPASSGYNFALCQVSIKAN